jgi:hypothetical protein
MLKAPESLFARQKDTQLSSRAFPPLRCSFRGNKSTNQRMIEKLSTPQARSIFGRVAAGKSEFKLKIKFDLFM